MTKEHPISVDEEASIELLGGFDRVTTVVDQVLQEHGFQRGLFTSAERERIRQGRQYRKTEVEFDFDVGKSLRANIKGLLQQAQEVQSNAGGTNYVGAMLQHLVGAKLDVVLGVGKIVHHGFSVADHSTERSGDYQVESVVIHVTTLPTEALIRKCAGNLQAGLRPVIVTVGDGVTVAAFLLKNSQIAERVDVLDVGQFLTANVYERSLFKAAACRVTFSKLLERYNEIVASCETDPSLRIKLSGPAISKEG